MSVPSARVRAMRLLHTSDWHLGRSLHRADLRAAQSAFLDHLVEVARAERVDAGLVAGDIYDRAGPPEARFGPPARVRRGAAGEGGRAPAYPARRAGPAGRARGRARPGRRL